MSQFSKEPPWVRDKARSSKLAGLGNQQTPIGMSPQGFSQPPLASSAMYGLPQPGIAMPTSLATSQVSAISYPTPRSTSVTPMQSVQVPQQQQKVFSGVVTKLHDNFGFIDDDVFFQMNCVSGNIPQVGDRVVVEASYNPSMPFKWNAVRVQSLSTGQSVSVSQQSSITYQSSGNPTASGLVSGLASSFPSVGSLTQAAVAQVGAVYQAAAAAAYQAVAASGLVPNLTQNASSYMGGQNQLSSGMMSRQVNISSGGRRTEGLRDHDRPRIREVRDRRSPRKRSRSPIRRRSRSPRRSKSRSRSRSHSNSPQRSRRSGHLVPRYNVQIPKISLDLKEASVFTLRSRYTNMYIPSDFFTASLLYTEAFPLYRPFELGHACQFRIMDKTADGPSSKDLLELPLDPPDADYRYSAKVMLLSMSSIEELYKQSCSLAEDPQDVRDSFQHPTRLVNFLVGLRGKSEPMAIGGPWSPFLDGPNPESDPQTLINTAVRTTLGLTGIDLSKCTQWYSFVEMRYHRQEEIRKGRVVPAHVETVVIFLPDVWSCCPSRLDWHATLSAYRSHLESKLLAVSGDEDSSRADTKEEDMVVDKSEVIDKKDPTHYSELDPKTMLVSSLRQELEARSLSAKGLKSQLIARLVKSLKLEQEKEEGGEELRNDLKDSKDDEAQKADEKEEEQRAKEEEEKRLAREKEREVLERKYSLPESPHIIVHPSSTAKSGRFDCTVMSLSVLLDYRPEDNKEHSFEVSLFAELFNEMLMRDFGFRIYKALVQVPEKVDEDKKDEDKKKLDDKKKTDDKKKVDEQKDDSKAEQYKNVDAKKNIEEQKDEIKAEQSKSVAVEKKVDEQMDDSSVEHSTSDDIEKKAEEQKDDGKIEQSKSLDPKMEVDEQKSLHANVEGDDAGAKESEKSNGVDSNEVVKKEEAKSEKKDVVGESKAPSRKKTRWSTTYADDRKDDEAGSKKDKGASATATADTDKKTKAKASEELEKMLTMDPGLLLAFVYFDQLHAGYLLDKDVEDILNIIGIQLSRAQVKKLLSKLISRDQLNYRKLTDRPVSKVSGDSRSVTKVLDVDDKKLALGNKSLIERQKGKSPSQGGDTATTTTSSGGLVSFNGAMVNVDSVVSNLNRSEKSRIEMEQQLKTIETNCATLRTELNSCEHNRQKLASERDQLRGDLREQRRELEAAQATVKNQKAMLTKVSATLAGLNHDITNVIGTPASLSDNGGESSVCGVNQSAN